jgi:GcrA cell cycle regulator
MGRNKGSQKWTPEQDAELKARIADGGSFSEAAAAINGKFGTSYSRNAAIGRGSRLGISAFFTGKRRKPKRTAAPKVIHKTIRIVRANANSDRMRYLEAPETDMAPLRCVEVIPLGLSLTDLAHNGCRYPYGDGPFTFCGNAQREGSSYCGPHWAISWSPQRKSNPAAAEKRRRSLTKQRTSRLVETFA